MHEWERIFGRKLKDKIKIEYDINNKAVYFRLEGETESKLYHKSLGFKWFFCFLLFTQFRGKRKDNSKVLFLFDEPASNLHATAQKRLLDNFIRIASDNCSIIFTTHSHYMINPKWLECTFISENEALNVDEHESEHTFDASKNISIRLWKYKHFVSKNPGKTTYYQPILDVLDYKPTALELTSNIILMEGKTDFHVIKYFTNVVFKDDPQYKSSHQIKIAPSSNGASGMDIIISLYLGWGYNFKIILDADKEGKKNQDKYLSEYGLSNEDVVCLDDIDERWKNYRLESLITDEDKFKLQKSEFPDAIRYNKDHFHKSLLIKLNKEEFFSFSEETLDNFHQLIPYILRYSCRDLDNT